MGLASIVLGVAAFVFMLGGAFLFWVPILGPLLAFGAPVLALAGCVTGGLGISRARQEGDSTGPATAGLIISIIGFLCGLVLAVTCGFCGALCTAASLSPNNRYQRNNQGFRYNVGWPDAAVAPGFAPIPGPGPSGQSGSGPPPAFPPPPLQPGTQPSTLVPSGPAPVAPSPDPSLAPGLVPPQPAPTTPSVPSPASSTSPVESARPGARRAPGGRRGSPNALPVDQGALPVDQGVAR